MVFALSLGKKINMDIKEKRLAFLSMKKFLLENSNPSDMDLESMTKSKILEFADTIGVTLSMSNTKSVMISNLRATSEFVESEKQRKSMYALNAYRDYDKVRL